MWSTAIRVTSPNGEVKNYSSINQACKELGLYRSGVRKCLDGKQKQVKGYTIEAGDIYNDFYSDEIQAMQKELHEKLSLLY